MKKVNEITNELSEEISVKCKQKILNVFILSILAGFFIAIGGFASTIGSYKIENASIAKLVSGAIFPIGLILITICSGDLFTGRCLGIIGLINKKITLKEFIKILCTIYLGNFLGATIFSVFIYFAKVYSNQELINSILLVATNKANIPFVNAIFSGIICNIIVCLAIFGGKSFDDGMPKMFFIWFTIAVFVITGTEHCVANMYYFSEAIVCKMFNSNLLTAQNLNILSCLKQLIPVTIGNMIGGMFCVGYIMNKTSKN